MTGLPSVTPPSFETTASIPVRSDQNGTTSVPSGRTTGMTPVFGDPHA